MFRKRSRRKETLSLREVTEQHTRVELVFVEHGMQQYQAITVPFTCSEILDILITATEEQDSKGKP